MSLVFYDTETTGTHKSFDQILQFAAIRTDSNLIELDRFEIRSRLRPHIVPSPGAMRVTGITAAQLRDSTIFSHYEMVRRINAKLLSWSPATFVGYNSMEFDEHLLRQALYQTLHLPYLTNTNGNTRSDVLRMVRAAALFVPNAIAIPIGDDGKPSFKLDEIAPTNGFDHKLAHDAVADVEATIFLCRLLAERVPELWSAFMRFSQKAAVVDYLESEPIFSLTDFYYGRPYSWLVTAIGANPENSSEHYVYDLSVHPESLMAMTPEQLAARLARSPKPIRRLRANAAPVLMPAPQAPNIAAAKSIGASELTHRVKLLRCDPALRTRLIEAFEATREEYKPSIHVEEQIYSGEFYSDADKKLLENFHQVDWKHRLAVIQKFADERLRVLGLSLVHHERPDLLDDFVRAEHDKALARRIVGGDEGVPWVTIPDAIRELDDLLASAAVTEAAFLREHRTYLMERLDRASEVLD